MTVDLTSSSYVAYLTARLSFKCPIAKASLMATVTVNSKGQITIPVQIRAVLPRQALAASDSQAYRAVEKHHSKMGRSTRSHSAGVPTVRNLQQTQSISRHAGTGAQDRFVSGKAQPHKCQSTLEHIKAEGYDGGYSQLTAFIRSWRGQQGKSLRASVPLTFALGEAFQFDWSDEGLLIGGRSDASRSPI
jgi:hypothetical protein